MSDDHESSGILSTVFGLIVLAIIWPYLLGLIGIVIAYFALLAIVEWISSHLILTILIVLALLGIVCVLRYRLIPKAYRSISYYFAPKGTPVLVGDDSSSTSLHNLRERKFIPSSNLYCYWCTKKLGIKAFELEGKYYCDHCNAKQSSGYK
jgi:uncharacterized membrane protein YjgN (DUF898 family)